MEGLIFGILRYDFRLGDSAQCTQDHFIILIHHSKKLQFYSLFKHDYKISSYLDLIRNSTNGKDFVSENSYK